MSEEKILEQLALAIQGIEAIKQTHRQMQADIAETKEDIKIIKTDVSELKLSLGKLEEKVSGIDTRLANEETISRNALGVVAGGTILAVIKYIFWGN